GWSVYEGSHPFFLSRKLGPTPAVKPAAEHHHSEARSLTGGIAYHGAKLPELSGTYIYGDFSTGRIWGLRHDGEKTTWNGLLADTTIQITCFAEDPKTGALWVVDLAGAIYEILPTPRDQLQANAAFPRRLSQTGLFTAVPGHVTDPALIPYAVRAPFWSDGASKTRYIAIPEKGSGMGDVGAWKFPKGTVFVKSFGLEQEAGNPASRRWIETRLFTLQQKEWQGY